jgi:SAM-dependent methyltransferase
MEAAIVKEGVAPDGGVLDVACGIGSLARRLADSSGKAWGLDPSAEMLGLGVLVEPSRRQFLVRGIAEALPFRNASVDRVTCEGALDHFVDPRRFVEEAARVLRPGGRLVVALANYDSLSCRIGRLADRLPGRSRAAERPYWQPPPDHHHRGTVEFLRGLGGGDLHLTAIYGVSMLWLLPGWGKLLDKLPEPAARAIFGALDGLGYKAPALADVMIGVWERA